MMWISDENESKRHRSPAEERRKTRKANHGSKNPLNGWAIPWSEKYLALRLAKKKPEKTLGGLYEALATGSTVI